MRLVALIFSLVIVHASNAAADFKVLPNMDKPSKYELFSQGKIIDKYTIDDKRSYTILYKKKLFVCEINHRASSPEYLFCFLYKD